MNPCLQLKNYVSFSIVFFSALFVLTASAQPSGKYGPESKNYSVPSGAYFVSPDGNGSAPCSEGKPCSLSTALEKAPAGGTIVMKWGTYRTSKYSTTTIRRRLTIQPYPGATVILKGSEVKQGWIASGNTWKGSWSSLSGKPNNDNGRAIDENPMADHRDMVYINGQSQWQVNSKSEVGPGKFYVDYSSKTIYIGSNPSGKQVEISAQWWGLNSYGVSASGITIRGLKLMHYTDAAIFIGSPGAIVENNEIVWNAAAGIRVHHASDVEFKNNLVAYNACQGGGFSNAHGLKLINNNFSNNNYEKFNRNSWSASGVKILDSERAIVDNNQFKDNDANGIWLDGKSNKTKVVNNFVKNNSRNGIHCEISDDVIIAGNVVLESGKDERLQGTGISVANSSGVKVYNNTLYNNEIALDVVEFSRSDDNDPNDPKITRNTVIKNNILSGAFFDGYPSALYHMKKKECSDKAIASQDNNAYYRSTPGDPGLAVRWKVNKNSCGDEERLETIEEFRNKLGYEKNGFGIQGGSDPFFVDADKDNYRLKSSSLAIKSGAPLPSDVAQAMGWESGKAVDIGAYQTNISQSPTADTGDLPWKETFTTSDRAVSDNGLSDGSAWSLSKGSMSDNAAFNVMDKRLQARGTVGEGSWRSESINIEGKTVSMSMMLYSQGSLENQINADYAKVYTKVDGVEKLVKELKGNIGSSGTKVSASSIKGKKLELIVKFKNSDYTEYYFLDNINVESSSSTPSGGIVEGISLVNEDTQQKINGYTDIAQGETINKSDLPSVNLNINANVSGNVKSIVFDYNGVTNYHLENSAPYALQGNESSYRKLSLKTGSNTITIKAYSEAGGKGNLLHKKTISFTVKDDGGSGSPSPSPSPSGVVIERLSLVVESTQKKVSGYTTISNGDVINKSDLPSKDLNLNAEVSGNAGSIVFDYNGVTKYQTESTAPYALQGNDHNYSLLSLKTGSNTITIKAYSEASGKGNLLHKKTINFTVTNGSGSNSSSSSSRLDNTLNVRVSPNPFISDINIQVEGAANDEVTLQVTDYIGNQVYSKDHVNIKEAVNLNLSGLPSKIYILRIIDGVGNVQNVRLQKN